MFKKIHIKITVLLVLVVYTTINIAFPFIEASKAWASTPVCVYPPGVYDPSSGYCVTNPLDAVTHSCPQYYTFNYETNKCVLMPVCNGMYFYDKNKKQCVPMEATTTPGGSSWTIPAHACAIDFNQDGEVQQNEIFACTQTPQGYICPQGQAECTQQISQPACPVGYTYNGQTQKCEAPTTIGVCSSQNVPYTDYQCPTNGQIYTDAATCNNNCIQYASCNADPLTLNAYAVNVNTGQLTPTNIGIQTYKNDTYGYSCCSGTGGGSAASTSVAHVQGSGNWFEIVGWDRFERYCYRYDYEYPGYCVVYASCLSPPIVRYRIYANKYCTFSGSYTVLGMHEKCSALFYIYGEGNRIRVRLYDKVKWSPWEAYIYVSGCTVSGYLEMWSERKAGQPYVRSCVSGNTIYGCTSAYNTSAHGSLTFTPHNPTYTCPLPGGSGCSGNPPTCSKGQTCVTHTSYTNKYQCSLNGAFYDTQDQCTSSCHSGCPAGGSFNPYTGKCEAPANCPSGTLQSNGCFTGYGCPLGDYQCMNINDRWMCSSNQCFTESQIENDEPDIIASTYDNATSNEEMCTGQWAIFTGSKMRCQKAGVKTGFHNCCDESKGKIYDNIGSTGLSAITDAVGAIYAATEAVRIGSYAHGIATGAISAGTAPGVITLTGGNLPSSMSFYAGTPDYAALSKAIELQGSASVDEVVGASMGKYIEAMGPQIATAVAQLAISQAIDDPLLASAVNLAFSSAAWAAGLGGPVGVGLAAATLAANLFMASCDKQDVITSTMADSGMCHYVGTYCTKKIKFVGCVQKVKSYCCFNSKLARIVHEQGRPQLASFGPSGGWGSEKHPNCRGFKPEEFQAINFDNIDLSEYTQDIERNARKNIEGKLQNTATQSLQNRGVR